MTRSETGKLKDVFRRLEGVDITGVSIDSRSIKEGELFVAIKGDRYDGHDFVPDALKKGAWGALVERTALENKFAVLGGLKNILPVEDTLFALQEMAYAHRKKFSIPVVGVTGSNGKTTTKEMLAAIAKRKGPVLKNEGNLNNHLGVPLTLMKLNEHHRAAVVEMGMSAAGEIDTLARIVAPTIGVITNIGPAHLEFFGSLEKIADAKGELLDNLTGDATAVLNADDPFHDRLRSKFSGPVVTFGIEKEADVRAMRIIQGSDHTDFTIMARNASVDVRLRMLGNHNVSNALAAAAAALAMGLPLDAVKYGLEEFTPVAMRSEIREVGGRTVLADFYNANPASLEAAIRTMVSLAAGRTAIAVLGDMLELGPGAADAHRGVGAFVARSGVEFLVMLGDLAKHYGEGARGAGMLLSRTIEVRTHEEAAELATRLSRPGDVILIKGSRGMKMEKVLEAF